MDAIEEKAHKINDEVFVARNGVVKVTRQDIDFLKERAKENQRGKCRLLLHRSVDDPMHEMLIVHAKGQYIRPHKNAHSSKSYNMIEGALACILFSDEGQINDHFTIGEHSSSGTFFVRLYESRYHTLIPLTDTVVFIETILGPFRGTTYAPWAPEEGESAEAQKYHQELCKIIGLTV